MWFAANLTETSTDHEFIVENYLGNLLSLELWYDTNGTLAGLTYIDSDCLDDLLGVYWTSSASPSRIYARVTVQDAYARTGFTGVSIDSL